MCWETNDLIVTIVGLPRERTSRVSITTYTLAPMQMAFHTFKRCPGRGSCLFCTLSLVRFLGISRE
jgi:hypothetical protein